MVRRVQGYSSSSTFVEGILAKKITQKSLKHDEFIDAAFDFGRWLEENWAIAAKWLLGTILVIIGIVVWVAYSRHSRAQLRNSLAAGLHLYEDAQGTGSWDPASLTPALETFDAAASRGGSSATGMLARFYQGSTLYRLGRLDEAAVTLEELVAQSAAGETLGATARGMLARVHVAAGHREKAILLLESILDQEESLIPPDIALLDLGRIHRDDGDPEQARVRWQRIVDEFPLSVSAAEARRLLLR